MTIKTNRFQLSFNIENIKNDFIFLRFDRGKNGKWWGAKELDYLIGDDYKAMSVCYTQNYAYAMFDRQKNNGYELINRLKNDRNFNKVSAKELNPEAINKKDDNSITAEALARLLLNSLGSSRSKFSDRNFSNLTGALLKLPKLDHDKFDNSIQVGEINFDYINNTNNEFLLNVSIATYRLKFDIIKEFDTATGKRKKQIEKYLKRPKYVIDTGKNILRRWLNSSETNPTQTYIKAGKNGKKAHQDFLDFSDLESFNISRAGILHQVINDIKKHLSQYLTLEFILIEIDQALEFDPQYFMLKEAKQLHSILEGQRINIIDFVNNEDSEKLVTTLEKELKKYFKNQSSISVSDQEIEGILNLRIIHDEKYYQKNKIEDQYLASNQLIQRQNITIESVKTASSAIVKTLIKELIIKQDLSNQKISLFDWSKRLNLQSNNHNSTNQLTTQLNLFDSNFNKQLNHQKDWIFAMFGDRDEDNDQDNEDQEKQILTFMTIHSDGSFEFENLDTNDTFFNDHQYEDYQKYIEEAITKEEKTKSSFKFEGFILADTGDINLIFRSDEITLPQLEKIKNDLKEKDRPLPEDKRNGIVLSHLIKEFIYQHPDLNKDKLNNFCKILEQKRYSELKKEEFNKLLTENLGKNSNEAKQLRKYLLEEYHIRLIFSKSKENLDYLFDNSLNIKYFGETETDAYYFVGDRSDNLQHFSFKDACHIRKIVAVEGSKLIFQELLKTMDVDFVRTGQSTVIPFPFKYIREYQNLNSSLPQ